MNKRFAVLLVAMVASLAVPTLAQTNPSGGSMKTQKPQCAAGDPVVGVNMTTKTYLTHEQMKAKTANMTKSQMHSAAEKNNMKLMCKSDAEKMGAKPMSSSSM